MKIKMFLTTLVISALPAFAWVANWNAAGEKAQIEFDVSGPFGKVHGSLKGLKTTISFDESNLASSSIKASVDVNTIETGNSLRNHDLLSKAEWFDAGKFPLISFTSKQVQKVGQGYRVSGDLTMKGITKPVDIPFSFSQNSDGKTGVFKGQFTVKRLDFGIGGKNSAGEDIEVTLNVPVGKQ